jgi:hypothetical protein
MSNLLKIPAYLVELRLAKDFKPKMTPSEFCETYLNILPGEWGWRKASIELLAEVAGCSPTTIENWWSPDTKTFDACPNYVLEILRREHQLRQIKKLIK